MTMNNPLRVLVIEDNPDTRETLQLLLTLSGHETRTAADGLEGLRLALAWRPEAVIADIGLPGMNGWDVGRQTRAALGENVLLIALTGYGQPADCQRSLEAGFDAHLIKPAEVESLLGLLHRDR